MLGHVFIVSNQRKNIGIRIDSYFSGLYAFENDGCKDGLIGIACNESKLSININKTKPYTYNTNLTKAEWLHEFFKTRPERSYCIKPEK